MSRILIIEDDTTIVEGLETILTHRGYLVFSALTGEEGLELFKRHQPDLLLLDIMLPGINGYQICKEVRELDSQIPIIILTAKSQESDKLLGFELGADDYVTKPFAARELEARIRALLKRSGKSQEWQDRMQIGDAVVDFANFTLKREKTEFCLSPKEREILKLLAENANKVVSRDRIIDEIWKGEYFPNPKTIDNFIRKLRIKLEVDPGNPQLIISVHGVGYRLKLA